MVDAPPCPHCRDAAFVRAEQIISGRRVTRAYYCGRCNGEWRVEGNHSPERRQAQRRRARLDEVIVRLDKHAARALPRARRQVG